MFVLLPKVTQSCLKRKFKIKIWTVFYPSRFFLPSNCNCMKCSHEFLLKIVLHIFRNHGGWEGGRKRRMDSPDKDGGRETEREDLHQTQRKIQGCSSPPPPPSIVFRCRVYKYPSSPEGQLSPAGPSLPPCSDHPPLFSPPCPAPSYPPDSPPSYIV